MKSVSIDTTIYTSNCSLKLLKGRDEKYKQLSNLWRVYFYLPLCVSVHCLPVFPVKNNSGVTPAGQCGTWVKEPEGGYFTSPNYPEKYPPERECVYIIEGEALIFFFLSSHVPRVTSAPISPSLNLSPSSSLSPTVHRPIL